MENKNNYVAPKVDIVIFNKENLMTTSGDGTITLPDDKFN